MSFFCISEKLTDIFVTESEIIDRYVGGTLWSWGVGNYGRIGDNTTISRSSPVQTVAGGANWKQVSGGSSHTAAIKTDGTLWLWGYNGQGRLGNNAAAARSSPVQTVSSGTNWKQVSAGESTTSAIKTDGTLWSWGSGNQGRLGDNTQVNKSSPVQTISSGTNWKQVSAGTGHMGAIKTDGTLWLWGYNSFGRLGDNTQVNKSSPVQTISSGNNWKQVSVYAHSAAIKTDGTLWLWGQNNYGRLGIDCGISIGRSSPVQTVSAGTNWKQVSVAAAVTAAIKTDGTLWVWGAGNDGRLGNNSTIARSSPVQTVSAGTNWKQVGAAASFVSAIKTDGTLWSWGFNRYGRLGDNTTIDKSSPVQTVAGGANWKQVDRNSTAVEFC